MNMNQVLFYLTYVLVGVGWIPLWIAPAKRFANWWLAGVIIPFLVSIGFTFLLLTSWHAPAGQSFLTTVVSRFLSLGGVGAMLRKPGLLDATWLDNLTTGIMVGAWITRRAQRTGLPRLALLLCQLLVFAASPIGVALYFIIEAARGRMNEPDGQLAG